MTTKKSHRIGSMLLALIVMLSLSTVFCFQTAHAEADGDWRYTVNSDGKITITQYVGTSKTITVPAIIANKRVNTVTELCNSTQAQKVTSIKFSSGIKEIGATLCKDYTSLTNVSLPNTLTTIGASAFANCKSLRSIALPSTVTSIGSYAFQGCTALYSATLDCAATKISGNMFSGCTSLRTLTLPQKITEIGDSAFYNCSSLTTVDLPNTIKTISSNAFAGCGNLKGDILLPTSIQTIKSHAFADCKSINSVIIPNSIKTIESNAFKNCTSLSTVSLGNGLKTIGNSAFDGCKNLRKIAFAAGYIKFGKIFDSSAGTVLFYPTAKRTEWNAYAASKTAYSAPTTVAISNNKTLTAGSTNTLKITVSPSSSAGKLYYLTSSNPKVATVNQNGVVTAKAGGTTTITVTTINGVSKSVTVTVNPKAVTNVKAVPQTTNSVKLTWTAGTNVTGYAVYRTTDRSKPYTKVATVTTNSYIDKGLTKGTTYYYIVKAYVKQSNTTLYSANSTYASVAASSPAPATVTATKTQSKVAKITWSKAIGAQGYEVYMCTTANGAYTKIGSTNSSTLSFTKTGLTSGKTYYFIIRSYITVNGKKVYSNLSKSAKCTV